MNRFCTVKAQKNKTVQISSNMNIFSFFVFSQWVNLMISSEFLLQPKKYRKVNKE